MLPTGAQRQCSVVAGTQACALWCCLKSVSWYHQHHHPRPLTERTRWASCLLNSRARGLHPNQVG